MSNQDSIYSVRAAELRKNFDESFATAQSINSEKFENVLTLRIESDLYAIQLTAIAGIVRCPRIVPVPCSSPALLGLAGVRGSLLPIYSLPKLLNYESTEKVQWLLLSNNSEHIALGIVEYLGCHPVPIQNFTASRTDGPGEVAAQVVTLSSGQYTLIELPPILKSIHPIREGH